MTTKGYALAAAGLLAGLAGFELVRTIMSNALPGYTSGTTWLMSITFIVVLGIGAAALALHRSVGWLFGVLGAVYALSYAIAILAGNSRWGTAYLVAGVVALGLLIKALPYYRATDVTATRLSPHEGATVVELRPRRGPRAWARRS